MMKMVDGSTSTADTPANTRYALRHPIDSMSPVMTGLITSMYTEFTVQHKPMARPAFLRNH